MNTASAAQPQEIADLERLRRAIENFADEHRDCRFGVLREIGAQASIYHHVMTALGERGYVDAVVVDKDKNPIEFSGEPWTVRTSRVRLESKILPSNSGKGNVEDEERDASRRDSSPHRRTDLIVYRPSGVLLVKHKNGPGDIVHRSFPQSILAAMEIKADPSHTLAQRQGYGRDIVRLLDLPSEIRGFFVLLDKSSPFYAPVPAAHRPTGIRWQLAERGDITLARLLLGRGTRGTTADWGAIVVTCRRPDAKRCVEIYDVSVEAGQRMRYYAYRDAEKAKRLEKLNGTA